MEKLEKVLLKTDWNKDSYRLMDYIYNYKAKCSMYEHYMFVDEYLKDNLKFVPYKYTKNHKSFVYDRNFKTIFNDLISDYELSKKYKYIYENRYNLTDFYNSIKNEFDDIKLLCNIKGELCETTTSMYMPEVNTCIITNDYSATDLLNLLSIKNLKILVICNYWIEGWDDFEVLFLDISITEKFRNKLLKSFDDNIKLQERTYDLLNKIICKKAKKNLNLKDVSSVLKFNDTYHEKIKNILTVTMMKLNNYDYLDQCVLYLDSIEFLSEYSVEFLNLYNLVVTYSKTIDKYRDLKKRERERSLYIDNISKGRFLSIKFLDEIIIEKEFKKRFFACGKWSKKYLDVINSNTKLERKSVTPGTIYEEALKEVTDVLKSIGYIKKAMLFGSVSNGTEKDGSDIDIAIELFFNAKILTKARQRTILNEVTNSLRHLQEKYRHLFPGFECKAGNPIHIINLTLQTKANLIAYNKSRFFDDAIVLFDRNSFEVNINDELLSVPYSLIDCVIVSTEEYQTYCSITLNKDEKNNYLFMHIPFMLSERHNSVIAEVYSSDEYNGNSYIHTLKNQDIIKLLNKDFDTINNIKSNCINNGEFTYWFDYREAPYLSKVDFYYIKEVNKN